MTSGPSVALEHVDAGHPQAHDLRGRTAVRSYSGSSSTASALPPRCTLRAELVALGAGDASRPRPGRRSRTPGRRCPCSRPRTAGAARCCLVLCRVSMTASATSVVRGEDDADALGALEELDDDGRAADPFDRRSTSRPIADERRGRDPDVVTGEDLQSPVACPVSSRCRSPCSACRRPSARTGGPPRCRRT